MFTIPTSFAIKALLSVQFDQSDSAAQRGQIDQRAVASVSACTLKRSAIVSKAKSCSEQTTRIPTIAKTSQIPFCDLICVDHMLAISSIFFLTYSLEFGRFFNARSGNQSPNLLQSGSLDVLFKATSVESQIPECGQLASHRQAKWNPNFHFTTFKVCAFWDDILPQART